MRKLTYFVACSTDGFIAREDGALDDFTMEGDHFQDLLNEFPETIPGHLRKQLAVSHDLRHFDTVVMGRRTYEVGVNIGVTSPYSHLRQVVVSRSMSASPDPDVELIRENPVEWIRQQKRLDGKDIWLCGGGALAASLADEIDNYILKMSPFLMGTGIPLIAKSVQRQLALQRRQNYDNGFMLLHYTAIR